jgi:hypothetical protein
MKFKSPTVERIMTRLSQSIAGGIFMPTFLFIALMPGDSGDSGRSLLETQPFLYSLAWPLLLWKYVFRSDVAYLATAVSNIIIYSLLTYYFIRWREKLKRLP